MTTLVPFSDVLASLRPDRGCWTAFVPEDWGQGRTVYGGLQGALILRGMRQVLVDTPDLPLRSLQVTFVGPFPADQQAQVRPELLRVGRTATHVRCDLVHDGKVACTAVGIFGAARPSAVTIEIPRPACDVDPETLKELPYIPGVTPIFVQHLQLRWASGTRRTSGVDEPRSLIYARVRDTDCTPEETLVALADSIPTPALAMLGKPPPTSSMNWTIELIGDPANLDRTGWSLIGTEVRAGADGYLSQTSVLWGPNGHAFSVSHQTVAIFG